MAAGRPKSINDTKVFDVAKPGKSKPMATSRPVIASRSIAVKDTTISDPENIAQPREELSPPSVTRKTISPIQPSETTVQTTETSEKTAPLVTAPELAGITEPKTTTTPVTTTQTVKVTNQKTDDVAEPKPSIKNVELAAENEEPLQDNKVATSINIKKATNTPAPSPNTEVNKQAEPEESTKTSEPKEATKQAPTEEPTEEPKEDEAAKTEATEEEKPASSDSASVDALAEASEKPKLEQKEAEEQAKRDAELQALIDSKKYVVPLAHDSTKKEHSNTGPVIILVLLIALIAAYVVIDARIIKTSISLPYHFFKQS